MEVTNFIEILLTLAGGTLGVWVCAEIAKAIPAIPIFKGDTLKIRAFTGLLSALVATFAAWQQGALSGPDIQNVVITLITFIGTWIGSHSVHKAMKPANPEDQV